MQASFLPSFLPSFLCLFVASGRRPHEVLTLDSVSTRVSSTRICDLLIRQMTIITANREISFNGLPFPFPGIDNSSLLLAYLCGSWEGKRV